MSRPALIAFDICFTLVLSVPFSIAAGDLPKADAKRMEQRILKLSEFGRNSDGGVDRIAYSKADLEGRAYIISLMEAQELTVRIDTAGNIIGRRAGINPSLKPIMFGSHIDSVPGGGNYDGNAGVIAALEVVDLLNTGDIQTHHPLDVVVFSNEEGGLIGSLAMTGNLKPESLEVVSHSGLTIRKGIKVIGGDPARLSDAIIKPGELEAFIELHIEQGGLLDSADIPIGVVEGIVGIGWWDVTIEGFANHAGTTPMPDRRDAMVAAAGLTLAINRIANTLDGRQVATVGRIEAFPGAPNVIPGRVEMSLEIRDLEQAKIDHVFALIKTAASDIADKTETEINFDYVDVASYPAPTDPNMRTIIAQAAKDTGLTYQFMPSGAGHDAQDMVKIAPTGMIFVPSVNGISHSPKEFTNRDDMAKGADVLLRTILTIDAGALKKQ